MIPYVRQIKILELLNSVDMIYITEIQEHLPDTSTSTIRRDLKILVEQGKIVELHGGAVKLKDMAYDTPVDIKQRLFNKEKNIIAQSAARMVHDGETIYIDSGTTLTYMFAFVLKKEITLVTTNTDIYKYVTSEMEKIRIISIGGEFNYALSSLAGPMTNIDLQMLHFDKAFLGASGFDCKAGITTPDFHEMAKKQIVKTNSKHSFFLLDSSKHEQIYVSQICPISEATIITDKYTEALKDARHYDIAEV